MKKVPFFTGLIVVLCGVACWLDSGNKQAPPVIDHIIATVEVPPQVLQEYIFTTGNKEVLIQTTMIPIVFSMLLIALALIIEWFNAKLDRLETQMKERAAQQMRQEVSKWFNEDVTDPIRKAEDYYTAWELLRDVNMQGDKLIIDCFKYGEKYPGLFDDLQKILFLKAGDYFNNVKKVSKEMKKAQEAFNKNISVNIFFLEGWCRQHIQPLNLHQIDKHILVMIYDHIEEPKLSLITSAVYTAQYDYSCEADPGKLLTYRSLYLPPKRQLARCEAVEC